MQTLNSKDLILDKIFKNFDYVKEVATVARTMQKQWEKVQMVDYFYISINKKTCKDDAYFEGRVFKVIFIFYSTKKNNILKINQLTEN